jgi:hypothetical protein
MIVFPSREIMTVLFQLTVPQWNVSVLIIMFALAMTEDFTFSLLLFWKHTAGFSELEKVFRL